MRTTVRDDEERPYGSPEDIAIPAEGGVCNEDVVGDERAATVQGRYLARTSDLTTSLRRESARAPVPAPEKIIDGYP